VGKINGQKKVFIIQKKIIGITAGVKRRVSCTDLFKKLNISPPLLLSLLSFVAINMEKFQTNSDINKMTEISK
jgi:hypothetical protein